MALSFLLALLGAGNLAYFFQLLLIIDDIHASISINKKIDVRFLKFVKWVIRDQSNLKEIAQLIQSNLDYVFLLPLALRLQKKAQNMVECFIDLRILPYNLLKNCIIFFLLH